MELLQEIIGTLLFCRTEKVNSIFALARLKASAGLNWRAIAGRSDVDSSRFCGGEVG
jgi:hypothetical protein